MSKHTTPFVVAATALLLTLAACNRGPLGDEYYMTHPIEPQKTRTIDNLDLRAFTKEVPPEMEAAVAPAPAELKLTLEEARATALSNNLDIQATLLDPTIARQSISEAEARFEALFFTNLNWSKTDSPTSSSLFSAQAESLSVTPGVRLPLTTGGSIEASIPMSETETNSVFSTLNPAYTADFQLKISQPLLRNAGPKVNTHAIRVARYDTAISEARTKLQIMSVIADVDRTYWRLYAARRALEVRKQEYDLATRQLERAGRLVEQGQAAEIEVIRAESGVAERLEAIIVGENDVRQRQRELKRALNRADVPLDSTTILIPATDPNPVQYRLDGAKLADSAMAGRMELLEDELEIAKAISELDVARNGVLPLLNLDYTYNVNGLGSSYGRAFNQLEDKNFEDHAIGVSAELPLGNMAAKAALGRATYNRLRLAYTKDGRVKLIRQEVLDAVDAIETNWQRIMAAQRRTILSARTVEGELRQFEQGQRTSTEVLEAQANLADAQLAEVQAIADYEIAQVDLAVATGTLMGAAKIRWEPSERVETTHDPRP